MTEVGKIVLIPCPISEGKISSISEEALSTLHSTTYFAVEKAKTARHFIKAAKHPVPLQELIIYELTKDKSENEAFLQAVFLGKTIGIISEAGCPGIADPGSEAVEWAHKNNINVIPLVGPSSIILALMASGFNGQNFAFNGYLSNKRPELVQQLKSLESKVVKSGQTQIFMETPYRNEFILETCTSALNENTRLCVGCEINSPDESIIQKSIKKWKGSDFKIYHKRPCIFIIG